jgi:uncharacterized lipoprotein NlpE involved in copper resistance
MIKLILLTLIFILVGCNGPKAPDNSKYEAKYIERDGEDVYIDSCVIYNTDTRVITVKVNCQDYYHPENYTEKELKELQEKMMKAQKEGKL